MSDPSSKYQRQRLRMVESQLAARGIRDPAVLEAFRTVRRHLFVPLEYRHRAYEDRPLPIGKGQTISQPYMVAVMVEHAALEGDSRVLEIGTGSGYQTALLSEIADQVFSIERIDWLARQARRLLQELGYEQVRIRTGDGTLGWPEKAPFDAILVSAGSPSIPQPLLDQLAMGGRLIIPLQDTQIQTLEVVTRTPSGFERQRTDPCSFVPLIGEHGWRE